MDEKALVGRVPGGACAIVSDARGERLDPECPPLRNDLCQASADLARRFLEACVPDGAGYYKQNARERYGYQW
jgi:hypothetical protein